MVANRKLIAGRKAVASETVSSSPLISGVAFGPKSEALLYIR